MQLAIFTLILLALRAAVAAPQGGAAPAQPPIEEVLSVFDVFAARNCTDNQIGTISMTGTRPFQDGGCTAITINAQSVVVTKVVTTCTVTLYTDEDCSNGVTVATLSQCYSSPNGTWHSFSTDGCF